MKKILSVVMIVVTISFSGCSESKGSSENKETATKATKNSVQEDNKKDNKNQEITVNQRVKIDGICEFQIDSAEWVDEIKPSNTSGVYSYYQKKDGETYYLLKGKLKNLSTNTIDPEYSLQKSQFLINEKYKLQSNWACEDLEGANFYGKPKPLQELNLIIWTSVPDEMKNSFEKATLTMMIKNNPERLQYYVDQNDTFNTYHINFVK